MSNTVVKNNMNKDITRVVLVTAGAFLFNMVFWNGKPGINTVLFDAFLLVALFFLYPQARHNAYVRWLFPGHLTCLAMVVVNKNALLPVINTIDIDYLWFYSR